MDDWTLLQSYAVDGSDEAFATLTARYLNLVHSSALRQCADPEQARDVTQAVFLLLARKASTLPSGTILSGWLYRTARFVALESVRQESRRKKREETVALINDQPEVTPEELWKDVAPRIDAAMEQLNDADRSAVLLRFFHDRSIQELAELLGINQEAAKKRVTRALERLRQQLRRQGVTSSSSLLSAALSAYAIQSAPAAMAGAIATAASAAGGSFASAELLTNGTLHMIAITKTKTIVACAASLLLMTGTVTVSLQHARVANELATVEKRSTAAATALPPDGGGQEQQMAQTKLENQQLQKDARQLYQLRNTVAQLQARARAAASAAPGPTAKVPLHSAPPSLRAAAETLRELQFQNFVAAGRKAITLQPLPQELLPQYIPEVDFMKQLGLSLRIYASKHSDVFPASLELLLDTDLLTEAMKQKLRTGRYEYHIFSEAEKKPDLPAVWWGSADEQGIRMMVMNDGSSHMIREPAGVELPGSLTTGGAN